MHDNKSLRVVPRRIEQAPSDRLINAIATTLDFALTVLVRALRYAPHTAFFLLAIVLWYMTPHAVLSQVTKLHVDEVRVGILAICACSAVVGLISAALTPERR